MVNILEIDRKLYFLRNKMTDIAGIPTPPIAEDLQINLDEVKEEVVLPENKEPEINFDLDLNLSDAPKNDNRLTVEDKKNAETNC